MKYGSLLRLDLIVLWTLKFSQGIGTETPYLQVDGYTFSGKYVAPLGTYIIMEEKDPSSEGKCFFPLDFKQFFKTALVLCNYK